MRRKVSGPCSTRAPLAAKHRQIKFNSSTGPLMQPELPNSEAPKKVFIQTWGCQMNVYDSTRMQDALEKDGYAPTQELEDADLVLLNTCHIREKAAEKVYSHLGRIRQLKDARSTGDRVWVVSLPECDYTTGAR